MKGYIKTKRRLLETGQVQSASSGVYGLFERNRLVYIGSSVFIPSRLGEHNIDYDGFITVKLPIDDAREVEKKLIGELRPVYNCIHNPDYYDALHGGYHDPYWKIKNKVVE